MPRYQKPLTRWELLQIELRRYATRPEVVLLVCAGIGIAGLFAAWRLWYEGVEGSTIVVGSVLLDGEPVAGAEVSVDGGSSSHATTNAFGAFILGQVPAGGVTLLVADRSLRCGYPVMIPPGEERVDVGTLPLFRWRALPDGEAANLTTELSGGRQRIR